MSTVSISEQQKLLKKKIFYRYKTAADLKDEKGSNRPLTSQGSSNAVVKYSIMDMLAYENNDLCQRIFMFENKGGKLVTDKNEHNQIQQALQECSIFEGLDIQNVPSYRFFQIKKHMVTTEDGTQRFTLQFIDISAKVFYDDLKAQEEFMSLITSTISHEMRNPLNSIISQCKIQEQNIRELKAMIAQKGIGDTDIESML